jgi:1,4-alpha-glucan branching enzyme
MPGDRWQQLATLRALLAYMWAHPGKQLLFMGGEFAQEAEWAESRSLDWSLVERPEHAGVQRLVRDLNLTYRATPALYSQDSSPAGFSWIEANDADNNVFSFLRYGADGGVLACVVNFAGVPHYGYRLRLPCAGTWLEVINTDAEVYGGSGVGNFGAVEAGPDVTTLSLPPLGVVWLTSPANVAPEPAARSAATDRRELRSTSPVETGQPDAEGGSADQRTQTRRSPTGTKPPASAASSASPRS